MGYSCNVIDSLVLDACAEILQGKAKSESSNAMPDGGFWQRGREQRNGSVTGTVFKRVRIYTDEERIAAATRRGPNIDPKWVGDPCRRAGSFKISNGKIVRFPGLSAKEKASAESTGKERYNDRYTRHTTMFLP
jgi:hypothetical protein